MRDDGHRQRYNEARATLQAAEAKQKHLREGLPHLFGFKWYGWAKAFFESQNRMNLLCAANQISKSSTQHRKMVHWATSPKLWPKLWPKHQPSQFWLLYPSKDIAQAEWETKIERETMPRGEFKNHPVYGWNAEFEKKRIDKIHFNTGVTIYVKSYAQDVHSLQSGTCAAIFCDEELPEELYSELDARLFATTGYFHMVFSATRNQLMWLRAVEGTGEEELFKDAFKQQISMYDCQTYTDGSPGHYSLARIKEIEGKCKSKTEVLRRVHGRFVTEMGRVITEFDPLRHFVKPHRIEPDWIIFSGVDNGSGVDGHPAAYGFIAVRRDMRKAKIFFGWRGDDVSTTAGDVVERWDLDRQKLRLAPAVTAYDWSAKDLATIAERMGLSFTKAEKSHEIGEDIVNTLFKFDMLEVFDTPELRKLGTEFMSVMKTTNKRARKDDLMDFVRYACCAVPWDWSALQNIPTDDERKKIEQARPWTEEDQRKADIQERRGEAAAGKEEADPLQEEFDFWNDAMGT